MPWTEQTTMSQRTEFCVLARQPGANLTRLCHRFGISRTTGYKWLGRAASGAGLADKSRRPTTSPAQTPAAVEARVVTLRTEHPDEGGRKLRARLQQAGEVVVPAASTITAILRRHELLDPAQSRAHTPGQRFEAAQPNDWWQMDFKGPVRIGREEVHPLVVLDDCSRFVLGVTGCRNQQGSTVWAVLEELFARYGRPWAILCDNGAPWGSVQANGGLTRLGTKLVRYGIEVWHGRPYRPQTQGKVERVNRTFGAAVLAGRSYPDLVSAQAAFDRWRTDYNEARPHEALGLATPASRYQVSGREFPAQPPPLVYEPGDVVRVVGRNGMISIGGRPHYAGEALIGELVALRRTPEPQVVTVYYAHHRIRTIDLREPAAAGAPRGEPRPPL